jgi:uncharacterized protein (UPF0297 family)
VLEETQFFSASEIKRAVINEVLEEVYKAIKKKGYNPIHQLVGYLVSGDATYITSYENARNKITGVERSEIIALILESYLEV